MTTPDPAALREALDEVSRLNDPSFDDYTFVMNAGDAKVLADAARWALDLIEGGKEVWFCNSTLAPRCRSDRPDPMGLGGHDSCQWVYLIPLGPKP